MLVKINGYTVPLRDLIILITAVFWMAGLSFQVSSNADEIEEQQDTKERLVSIEVTLINTKENIDEIKEEQKEQSKMLDRILVEVLKD